MVKPILRALFRVASKPTKVTVGGNCVASPRALIGQTDDVIETEEGTTIAGRLVTFIYIREEFVDSERKPIAIDDGTEISRQIGEAIHVHEVLPRDQQPQAAVIDPDQDLLKVLTRHVRTLET